jgi:hypothetical protein
MRESNLDRLNQLAATRVGARLFRNATAQGWVGKTERVSAPMAVQIYPGDVVIRSARQLQAGLCVGSSDLIGWFPKRITHAHVGSTIAQFVAVEDKSSTGRLRPEQIRFLAAVTASGGLGIVARSEDDLLAGLR